MLFFMYKTIFIAIIIDDTTNCGIIYGTGTYNVNRTFIIGGNLKRSNMSVYNKLYLKIKNNPKDVSFKEIDKLLTKAGGFTRRNPKGGSSHYTYSHCDLSKIITIPKNKPVKPIYIKKALRAFDMVKDNS